VEYILQYSTLEVGDWLSKGEGGMMVNRGRCWRKEEEGTGEARGGRRHAKIMNKKYRLCTCHYTATSSAIATGSTHNMP